MLFFIFLACTHNGQVPPEDNTSLPAPIIPEAFQADSKLMMTTGVLSDLQEQYSQGTTIEISYLRQYPNGCYEQTSDNFEINGYTIEHHVAMKNNTSEGQMCTMAIKPGGFKHQLQDLGTGKYSGRILLNNEIQIKYGFEIIP